MRVILDIDYLSNRQLRRQGGRGGALVPSENSSTPSPTLPLKNMYDIIKL
jgi:hypothetical protein